MNARGVPFQGQIAFALPTTVGALASPHHHEGALSVAVLNRIGRLHPVEGGEECLPILELPETRLFHMVHDFGHRIEHSVPVEDTFLLPAQVLPPEKTV